VALVLEVRVRHARLLDEFDHPTRLGHVASERLFANNALQFGALPDRVYNLLKDLSTLVVFSEQRNHVHVGNHLLDAAVQPRLTDPVLIGKGDQLVGRGAGHDSCDFDSTNLAEGAHVKCRDKSTSDNPVS